MADCPPSCLSMLFTLSRRPHWSDLLWRYTGYDYDTLRQFKKLIANPGSECCLLEDLNDLRDMTVYFGWPLSFPIHAWQLGLGNLCLASLNRFPLMRLIEWPFIHRGLLMCHSSNVNHQASLANWQSSIHCLLCECSLSKSRACVSSLIPWCGTRWRESPMTLFYSPRLTLLSFFYANRQSRGTLIRCSVALQDSKLTRSHPDSLHHHVNVHREFSL